MWCFNFSMRSGSGHGSRASNSGACASRMQVGQMLVQIQRESRLLEGFDNDNRNPTLRESFDGHGVLSGHWGNQLPPARTWKIYLP